MTSQSDYISESITYIKPALNRQVKKLRLASHNSRDTVGQTITLASQLTDAQ